MLLGLIAFIIETPAFAAVSAVPYVDPVRYVGTWYQVARKPVAFEAGCVCSRQVLTPSADGTIGVRNSCNDRTPSGALREISGSASIDNPGENSKLTVDFGLPRKGKYWIIGLEEANYAYAVVSEPGESTLYILSRTPDLPESLYQEALAKAAAQMDTSSLTRTLQAGCIYPD